ncbi:hypothetical protein QTJ16_006857 [Diplocarpon rosae]|uniref:Uncharacterized protein n=1 Tax=Diplocarpon rosae TaxID=946125 RepID=A0AAD9STZ0_9HELO|nr:hypothetical protein QTJ16_006857 [Diplocarpon rosae]
MLCKRRLDSSKEDRLWSGRAGISFIDRGGDITEFDRVGKDKIGLVEEAAINPYCPIGIDRFQVLLETGQYQNTYSLFSQEPLEIPIGFFALIQRPESADKISSRAGRHSERNTVHEFFH